MLNPGRTFGALEFKEVYEQFNQEYPQTIAETQTIIYTCRKTAPDAVNVAGPQNGGAPFHLQSRRESQHHCPHAPLSWGPLKPARSMVETSIGQMWG